MPTYGFECARCGCYAELFLDKKERDLSFHCTACAGSMRRVPVAPQQHQSAFVPGAEFVNKATGERKVVGGLFNKEARNTKRSNDA